MAYDSSSFGVVALAAYRPDWDLFRTQLRSIQDQSHTEFVCLISADGGDQEIAEFVKAELNDDSRFRVLGFPERLGFYGNFERVLQAVPHEAQWVALADQDDLWYPSKLETLIPQLSDVALVSGQARVVRNPGHEVVADSTARKNVPFGALVAQNQVTGSLCVFRRELLDLALPFPRLETITQVHDHWLAVCAAATGGAVVVEDVLQDYVQHGGNVLGEVEDHQGILSSWRHLASMSKKYHGSQSLLAMLRTSNDLSFGWRRTMMDSLKTRVAIDSTDLEAGLSAFSSGHSWGPTLRVLWSGLRSGDIAAPCVLEFVAGAPAELFVNGFGARGR